MKMRARTHAEPKQVVPSATCLAERPEPLAIMSDHRPLSLAQTLAASIPHSPHLVAQRQQMHRIFGPMVLTQVAQCLSHETRQAAQQTRGRVESALQMKGEVSANNDTRAGYQVDARSTEALCAASFRSDRLNTSAVVLRNPGRRAIQFWTYKKDTSKGLADTMSDKRVEAGFWNYTGLQKNFAFDKDDASLWAHSQGNRHAEPGVLISSLGKYPGVNINLVTERFPCGDDKTGCQSDIARAEKDGKVKVHVLYFVNHDDKAQDNLQAHYQQWWKI